MNLQNPESARPEELHLYEWAVVRYVPKVEREEFFNIGVILLCKRRREVMLHLDIDTDKFKAFGGDITLEDLSRQLEGFRAVAEGGKKAGAMAGWAAEERFRWLTAMKSACIQTSRPHPGKTPDIAATFSRLCREYL